MEYKTIEDYLNTPASERAERLGVSVEQVEEVDADVRAKIAEQKASGIDFSNVPEELDDQTKWEDMKYTLIALDTFSLERDFLEFEEWDKLIDKARELEKSNHKLTAVVKANGQTIDLAPYLNGSLSVDPAQTSLF